MDREQIKARLPHRDPFLMVDRMLEIEPGVRAVGIKDVRGDESWAAGHFPGNPILPGVLIAEALAQVAAVAYLSTLAPTAQAQVFLVGFDKMRFRRVVRPGESLRLETRVLRQRAGLWFFEGEATVGDERAADGVFIAKIEVTA